jgi:hypothetical protein
MARSKFSLEERKENRKKYKQKYFQENKKEIYKRRKKQSYDYVKNAILKSRYGITLDEMNSFYIVQKGRCAICNSPFFGDNKVSIRVDHDHKKNQVRALLCQNCNLGLGHFKENIITLKEAIKYLEHGYN